MTTHQWFVPDRAGTIMRLSRENMDAAVSELLSTLATEIVNAEPRLTGADAEGPLAGFYRPN
jgi:hypothetical protein